MSYMLPFEKPLLEFQHKLDELKKFAEESNIFDLFFRLPKASRSR